MNLKRLLFLAVLFVAALSANKALAGSIRIEVEDNDAMVEGTTVDNDLVLESGGTTLGFIDAGDYVTYNNLDLTNVTSFSVLAGSKKNGPYTITMHTDNGGIPGDEIASVTFVGTGGWQTYVETEQGMLSSVLTGENKIHFVLSGGFNIDAFLLHGDNIVDNSPPAVGDTFTEGDYDFTVTSLDPLEAEVKGSTLTNVVVPATATHADKSQTYTVTAVGSGAFLENTTITSVVLPSSVTVLKGDSFSGCVNLETINLENIVTIETQNAFFNCPKLTTANLNALTDIGNFTFHGLGDSTLSTVNIPSAVNIGRAAFRTAQMTSIDIPASVVLINTWAFRDCTALTEVKVNWTEAASIPVLDITQDGVNELGEPTTGQAVFYNVDVANVDLLVPAGTASLYQAVDGWSSFNIVDESLSTDVLARELGFNIYPTLAEDVVYVQNNQLLNTTVSIVGVNGQTVFSTTANSLDNTIDVSGLAPGVYLMKVVTEDYAFVERIVKQ